MKLTSGLAVAAVVTAVLVPSSAVAAPAEPQPSRLAADWISTQLTGGVASGDFGPDAGLSIDAGLALDALGRDAAAASVADGIGALLTTTEANPYGYVSSDEYDFEPPYDFTQVGYYANATAKAAAFAGRVGRDPRTAYDSVDLIGQLEQLTDDTTGVIADDSSYGNYANAIGQSFAVEALARAGSPEADAATDALLAQQCPKGYFLFDLGSTDCGQLPGPDTTALAVISLRESGITSARVAGAVSLATQWLENMQQTDGSFVGDAATPGSNANSTGLAGWALGLAGRTASASRAAGWTRGLQAADPGACATQAPTGAIAYDAADLASARSGGLGTKAGIWRRATFQAAPALLWAPAATSALGVSAPAAAAAGSTVDVVVRGLATGEHACVTTGATKRLVTGTGADLTLPFALPTTAPASHTFAVTTLEGTSSATTSVAAPAQPVPAVGDLRLAKVVTAGKRAFTVRVACEGTEPCAGRVVVRTAKKVERAGGAKKVLVVAKARYTVDADGTAKVRLPLTRAARTLLEPGRTRVVATQTASGAEPATTKFWLKTR